jgi:hypothetical protein
MTVIESLALGIFLVGSVIFFLWLVVLLLRR